MDAIYKEENLWLTQKGMAKVFDVGVPATFKHLRNIFESEQLIKESVVSKMENTTQHESINEKTQTNEVKIYNFDAIIAVDYRVNSEKVYGLHIMEKCS